MAVDPKPNTQPIYPKKIFTWRVQLLNQITPYAPIPNIAPGLFNQTPVKLGTAGECGALVWQLHAILCGNSDPLNIILYTRREGDTDIFPRSVFNMVRNVPIGNQIAVGALPVILPNDQKGLHFEANEEVFVGLVGPALAIPVVVYMVGGHY